MEYLKLNIYFMDSLMMVRHGQEQHYDHIIQLSKHTGIKT